MRRHPARGQGGEESPGQLPDRVTKPSPLALPGTADGGGQGARNKRSHMLLLDPRESWSRPGREGGAAPASSPQALPLRPRPPLCTGHPVWTGCTAGGSRSDSAPEAAPLSAGSTGHACPCLHGPDGQCAVSLVLIQVKIEKVMFRNYICIYRERRSQLSPLLGPSTHQVFYRALKFADFLQGLFVPFNFIYVHGQVLGHNRGGKGLAGPCRAPSEGQVFPEHRPLSPGRLGLQVMRGERRHPLGNK